MVKRRKKAKVKALAAERIISKKKDISDSVIIVLLVILILVSIISIGIYLNALDSVKSEASEAPTALVQPVSSQAKGTATIQILPRPEQQDKSKTTELSVDNQK
ncbi:MAG: hypothetical protein AB1668_04220 [Nanoarchaeota archaeon]